VNDVQPTDVVERHSRVRALGETPGEQVRAGRFARDLARWLVGRPEEELGPLVRVVAIVARRELADARTLCRDRPLLAVEAAARATEALWPFLRSPEPPPPQEDRPAPGGEGGDEETDETDETDEFGGEDEATDEGGATVTAPDPDGSLEEALAALREMEGEGEDGSEELAGLADSLQRAVETPEDGAGLQTAAQAAADGALASDRLAHTLEQLIPGVGWSSAPASLERTLLGHVEQLAALLERLPDLKKLADHLGRLEEASRRKGTAEGGREEVVGVNFGGDVTNALPSELALLGDEDTEDLFYQRYLERRLVSLELAGRGDEGSAAGDKRGPVIACIDTSSSMSGAPEMAAKALVLAVCRKVMPQGRVIHLILFGGYGERTEIRLRRGLGGLESLLGFLGQAFQAGTDFDGPLLRAMELLEERDLHAADILVVTDGLGHAESHVVDKVNAIRATRGVRVFSVVLGRAMTQGIAPFSDEIWQLDPGDAAASVGLIRRLG
jgi:uncharacterized protein with von Willebrand factor type A (vWA) domain